MAENTKAWGSLGDKLTKDAIVSAINAQNKVFESMADKLRNGLEVTLNPRLDEVEWVLRIYNIILKNPVDFKPEKVKRMLAGLPNTLGGKYIIPAWEVGVHLEVSARYRDYKDVLPPVVKDTYLPVKVSRHTPKEEWFDRIIEAAVNKNDVRDLKAKLGVYIHCVGWSTSLGGSVTLCPAPGGVVDIHDAPKFRCKDCSKEFNKARDKARRGSVSGGGSDKDILDMILG